MPRTMLLCGLLVFTSVICHAESVTVELLTVADVTEDVREPERLAGPASPAPQRLDLLRELPELLRPNPTEDDPKITLVAPSRDEVVSVPFELKIKFEASSGAEILPDTVVVANSRTFLQDRLKDYIKVDGIEISKVSTPPGEHSLVVLVRDSAGRTGALNVPLKVQD